MHTEEQKKKLNILEELKKKNNYKTKSLKDLRKLPVYSGIFELFFRKKRFLMLNIYNDDAIPLKYFWRGGYENLSLDLWYLATRKDGAFLDIGAHTGLYSIVGNLNKKQNQIISIEAFYMNYARLMSNLKLNSFSPKNCILGAATNKDGYSNFQVPTSFDYHSSGGRVSERGNLKVQNIVIDGFKLDKKIRGIKIDTEGNEYNVLLGAENSLKKDKPIIIFEINKRGFEQCISLLSNLNYKLYFLDEVNNCSVEIKKIEERFYTKLEGSNCYAKPQN
jgi:FkbM family methyltransferase